jgi:hypothetical protein
MDEDKTDDDANKRAAAARAGSPYLNTAQAAHYLGISERTLEDMRGLTGGPVYRKHGSTVRYHILDLDAWSAQHKRASTRLVLPPKRKPSSDDTPKS